MRQDIEKEAGRQDAVNVRASHQRQVFRNLGGHPKPANAMAESGHQLTLYRDLIESHLAQAIGQCAIYMKNALSKVLISQHAIQPF